MDFWVVLAAVGSVASIVGLFLPLHTRRQRLVHVVYGVAIVVLTVVAMWFWGQYNRVQNVERAATVLVSQRAMAYTHEGFIQASLAFLEKNKDLYPDAYARAEKLCQMNNCLVLSDSPESIRLASALEGLLKGIGTLEGGS